MFYKVEVIIILNQKLVGQRVSTPSKLSAYLTIGGNSSIVRVYESSVPRPPLRQGAIKFVCKRIYIVELAKGILFSIEYRRRIRPRNNRI